MGGLQIGFLEGRELLHPKTFAKINGVSQKRKNEEPNTETSSKRRRIPNSDTRPVIRMVLHKRKERHQIRTLLDTGCLVALISEQMVGQLGLKRLKHKQTRSIENYTGENIPGAGQFYMQPLLMQHRKHYTKESFKISPMDPEVNIFLPFSWITKLTPQDT